MRRSKNGVSFERPRGTQRCSSRSTATFSSARRRRADASQGRRFAQERGMRDVEESWSRPRLRLAASPSNENFTNIFPIGRRSGRRHASRMLPKQHVSATTSRTALKDVSKPRASTWIVDPVGHNPTKLKTEWSISNVYENSRSLGPRHRTCDRGAGPECECR
jgi:hypothetical protein